MDLLEIRNITRRFGAFEAVKDVSFAVASGEFFTLLGRPAVARPPSCA